MSDSKPVTAPTFIGIDPARPLSLWQKFKLLFCHGRISSDGTSYVVARYMDGMIYIVDQGEYK